MRRYLQPPLPSRAARPPPQSPAARPQVPGSSCGSPSSCQRLSCRTPADNTSQQPRQPQRSSHVTRRSLSIFAKAEDYDFQQPMRRPCAASYRKCGSRFRCQLGGPGVCSLLRAGVTWRAAGAGGEWLVVPDFWLWSIQWFGLSQRSVREAAAPSLLSAEAAGADLGRAHLSLTLGLQALWF